jgi:hypothetical protein
MMDGNGWYVQWESGAQEIVAGWIQEGDGMVPLVASADGASLVAASDRGAYKIQHPQQFTRGH